MQKELCKLALGQGNHENITEEMADVEIMLEQMKIGLDIGLCDLDNAKSQKLCRLSKRLDLPLAKEKILQNEAKCRQCIYSFMTEEALVKLGNDPCDTCYDICNWKQKEVSG